MSDNEVTAPVEPTPAVPVLQKAPSSESPTQQPEAADPAEAVVLPLADAAIVLVTLVRDGRRAGDGDVDAAIADIEASIAAEA